MSGTLSVVAPASIATEYSSAKKAQSDLCASVFVRVDGDVYKSNVVCVCMRIHICIHHIIHTHTHTRTYT